MSVSTNWHTITVPPTTAEIMKMVSSIMGVLTPRSSRDNDAPSL
jgi:hypothetical protein